MRKVSIWLSCLLFSMQVFAQPKQPPYWLQSLVKQVASEEGVDHDFVMAVIWTESAYNPYAVSNKGAQGLMQLMPMTARELGVNNTYSPVQNVRGGTRYLRQMLVRFGTVQKALHAYNCGPNCVTNHRVPSESFRYANKVITTYRIFKAGNQ